MLEIISELTKGLGTAYINENTSSSLYYRPQFVRNDYKEGKKVLSSIEDELLKCETFQISVAFITMGGITPLLQTLKELEKRNVKGQILTTNYLNFSEPRALQKLAKLRNVEIKLYDVDTTQDGFHTKGYIFKNDGTYRIIIGSSNLTSKALTVNQEWNTKVISTEKGEMAKQIVDEFTKLWNSPYAANLDQVIAAYEEKYNIIRNQREAAKNQEIFKLSNYTLQPNSMQVNFVTNLKDIVNQGKNRALLISSTGTGKTYASAFAMREMGFQKVLFLVHRGQLASQTKKSYENVFSSNVSMGLVGNGCHEFDCDYVFATVQTMSKDEYLTKYDKKHFDCIILDEAHHSSAQSYQKIMNYFQPKLWLGMTATPDKRDDYIEGKNIYEIFDHQIAYEIRLQQALEENMLCPFHYFGISDLTMVDDQTKLDDMAGEQFRSLTGKERVKHIVEQAAYYGHSGDRVKGLIFCSRLNESAELSKLLNETINPETGKYFRTISLNGDTGQEEREQAFERLAMDETNDDQPLDYILSVEILNEGVDVIQINQVIMLRPTQSPIVFIQQLGRGLRKAEEKEYVVVLDFIGNYKNNFMIPIALSGDRTYNKDNVRRYVMEGGRVIPGASSIHFDEISRKRILSSIDNANFSDVKLLKENYFNLRNKLGRIPALMDFDTYGEMDVMRIFDNPSLGSYHAFLKKYEPEYTNVFTKDEEKVLEFISKKLAEGKRIQELLLLQRMIEYSRRIEKIELLSQLKKDAKAYGKEVNTLQEKNIVNILSNEFATGTGKNTYKNCVFLEKDGTDYQTSRIFSNMLENEAFYQEIKELVAFGIHRNQTNYKQTYQNTDFVLYKKYTYEDVCRLLNWQNNEVPLNIGGYKYDDYTKTFPVFINYDKTEDISDTTKYEDHFTDHRTLIAVSKSGRTVDSADVQNFLYAKERGIDVELFVRKNKDDHISKEFYYLGRMVASGQYKEFIMPNTTKHAVEIEWILDVPVRDDIYAYITSG